MSKIQKAIEISDAKIQFVSLVDKAANKRQFLITKQEGGQAQFSTYSKILKVDTDTHYITGIVYEPLTEDAHGNFMSEDEIRKAAYWFAKNGDSVDLQHSFESADGLAVVENYVAPSDLTIGDTPVIKGSWIITVECTDEDVWQAVQKGELTGFSMGGIGKYSEEDVDLETVSKSGGAADKTEKKTLLKRLGELFGMDIVEKGEVLDKYNASTKSSAFWNAMWALEDVLYRYNWSTDRWEFASDEATIREALEDFNNIITTILSDSNIPIIKAVELPVTKAGKKMSSANKAKLDEICQALSDFKSAFEDEEGEGTIEKKEEPDMTKAETEAVVNQAVVKALEDAGIIKKSEPAPAAPAAAEPAQDTPPAAPGAKEAEPTAPAATPAPAAESAAAPADLDTAVEKAVEKALIKMGLAEEEPDPDAPITKGDVEEIVKSAIAPMLKAFSVPSNLNNQGAVEKSENTHFLHGIL